MEQYNNLLPTRPVPLLIPHSWTALVFKQLTQQNAEQLNRFACPFVGGFGGGQVGSEAHHYATILQKLIAMQVLYQEHRLATSPGSSPLLGIKGRAGRSPMGPPP